MRLLLGTVICVALAAGAGAAEQNSGGVAPAKRKAQGAPSLSEAYSQTQSAGVPGAQVHSAPARSSDTARPWTGFHVGVNAGGAK